MSKVKLVIKFHKLIFKRRINTNSILKYDFYNSRIIFLITNAFKIAYETVTTKANEITKIRTPSIIIYHTLILS